MSIFTIKRLVICLFSLGTLTIAGMHPTHVDAAPTTVPLTQASCTLPATVTTADELYDCITAANAGSGTTITLGADIDLTTLTTSPLPQITNTILVAGAGYTIDGGSSMRIFSVGATGDLIVNQTTLQNGAADLGGAIFNDGGTVNVFNSTLSGNSSNGGGGAIYSNSVLAVSKSTFTGNSAGNYGGAILNNGGTARVTNSTFSGNVAAFGGGAIQSDFGTLTVTSSTFSGNSSNLDDAIYNGSSSVVHLAGNIFANGAGDLNCGGPGTLNDNGYNLSDDGTCTNGGTGSQTFAMLNLGALSGGVFTPADPSDAIAAIPNGTSINNNGVTLVCNGSATDQLGSTRPIVSGDACTSGAVEVRPRSLTIVKDANPSSGTDFTFTFNRQPLSMPYTGSTSGAPTWTRPNEGTSCTLSSNTVNYRVQAFVVDTSGTYFISSQQKYDGYLHLYQDSFDPGSPCTNYLDGDNDNLFSSSAEIIRALEAGRAYYVITSGNLAGNAGNFTNTISGPGTVYSFDSSFMLDDAVPDDSDSINDSITFSNLPIGTHTFTEYVPDNWNLSGAVCTGGSDSGTLSGDTLSVALGAGENVTCTFTNEFICNNIVTENQLAGCITEANSNGAGLDTLTLGADINLASALPDITSTIVLEGAGYAIDGSDSVRIFYVQSGSNLTINQTTLQNGFAGSGGAIYNNGGTVTVTNSAFSGNSATNGGGIWNVGVMTVTNSSFSNNSATNRGGAILSHAAMTVTDSTFSGNSAVDGGGIWNDGGDFKVINSTFSDNSATNRGGGIYGDDVPVDVTRSTFSGNTAGVAGGAISTDDFGTNLRITNSTFSSNSAANAGGATYSRLGRVTVTNSTFSGNSASTGGAVNHIGESTSSRLNVTNSTFSGNSAVDGGAMYSIDGTLMATNSTFFGNSATNTGSSIFSDALDATVARMFLSGNIFEGGGSSDNCVNVGTFNDRGYNLSDDGTCTNGGTGSQTNATLNLGALSGGVHTPQAGSDAIGAIPNGTSINNNGVTLACNGTTRDQLGSTRPINAGTACTSGAVEVELQLCPSWTVTTADKLYECITKANSNGAGLDTITLGADINLTSLLPQITSTIVLEGAGYAIDGGGSIGIFEVGACGNLTVNQATLQNGFRSNGGGIYNAGTVTVTSSTLSGNSVNINGGAIYNNAGTVIVTSSTLSGNTADDDAGAIYNNAGSITLTYSTFASNSALVAGANLYNDSGTLHMAGNVFARDALASCVNFGALNDNGYNLSSDGTCTNGGTGSATNATLNLGALSGGVHTPQAGSDAIGAIPNGTSINNNGVTLACNGTTTDQLGSTRPINIGTACTSGAVEVAMPPICTSWTVTTADELYECITKANINGARLDTITLGADIDLLTLSSSPLPQITSTIVVEGAGYAIDGGDSVRIFEVGASGNLTVNQATLRDGSASSGGGIRNLGGTVTVTDSTISGNSASSGGGIENYGTVTLIKVTVVGNSATNGGGIENYDTVTVSDSTFSGNSATISGGGIWNAGTVIVTGSTLSGNSANSGGSLYNENAAIVTNSTFSGNTASDGGAIENEGGGSR